MKLSFRAVEATNVMLPAAVRVGVHRCIGKVSDGASWKCTDEAAEVEISGPHAAEDKQYLRKCVLRGELECADEATEKALGL